MSSEVLPDFSFCLSGRFKIAYLGCVVVLPSVHEYLTEPLKKLLISINASISNIFGTIIDSNFNLLFVVYEIKNSELFYFHNSFFSNLQIYRKFPNFKDEEKYFKVFSIIFRY